MLGWYFYHMVGETIFMLIGCCLLFGFTFIYNGKAINRMGNAITENRIFEKKRRTRGTIRMCAYAYKKLRVEFILTYCNICYD